MRGPEARTLKFYGKGDSKSAFPRVLVEGLVLDQEAPLDDDGEPEYEVESDDASLETWAAEASFVLRDVSWDGECCPSCGRYGCREGTDYLAVRVRRTQPPYAHPKDSNERQWEVTVTRGGPRLIRLPKWPMRWEVQNKGSYRAGHGMALEIDVPDNVVVRQIR